MCIQIYQFTFVPFSNLVNIYFKYFKILSSLQFQNSLYIHSLFNTLKSCIILFLDCFKIRVNYCLVSYGVVKFMTRASSEKVSLNMHKISRFTPAGKQHHRKVASTLCARWDIFQLPCMQSHLGLWSRIVHFALSNESVSRQRRPWSGYAFTQSDLGLRCPHMSEDTLILQIVQFDKLIFEYTFFITLNWLLFYLYLPSFVLPSLKVCFAVFPCIFMYPSNNEGK